MALSFFMFGYFCGAIPFGYLISKFFFNKDVRTYYSKNIGATNVARVLGWKVGVLVFILDFLKGYLPSIVAYYKFGEFAETSIAVYFSTVTGCGAIWGHINPYILNFKGGKGIATFFGFIFAVNLKIALISALIWIILFLAFKISAVGSITSVIFALINFFLPYWWNTLNVPLQAKIVFAVVGFVILLKHFENIIRIIEGKEFKV